VVSAAARSQLASCLSSFGPHVGGMGECHQGSGVGVAVFFLVGGWRACRGGRGLAGVLARGMVMYRCGAFPRAGSDSSDLANEVDCLCVCALV
jgi:hypothetical protein